MAGENIFIFNNNSLLTKENHKFLMDEGYNIKVIFGLDDLHQHLKHTKPDLLIFEVFLLTSELTKFIMEVRKMKELRNVPCIAVLFRTTRSQVIKLAQMGIKEMLVKPVTGPALLKAITKSISPEIGGNIRIKKETTDDGYTIVEFFEKVDVTNSMKIDSCIDHLIKKGVDKIAIDLKRVNYIDSAGIGILVVSKKKMDNINGDLKLINVNNQVKKVFTSLHIDQIIKFEDEVEAVNEGEKA